MAYRPHRPTRRSASSRPGSRPNPRDYVSYRILGEFHERKAEETGDLASYERAEAALRKPLEMRPNYDRAKATLAAVLCSRHKFAEGLAMARVADRRRTRTTSTSWPPWATPSWRPASTPRPRRPTASSARSPTPRRSSPGWPDLSELKGDPDEARPADGRGRGHGPGARRREGRRLVRARLGDIAFVAGRVDEAESHYRSVPPGIDPYHDATAALGRLRAGQGRLDEAVALYRKAVAIGPDPHMLAALGDLYVKLGRKAEARPLFDRVVSDRHGQAEYLRVLSLFYADHDRDLPRALELARLDLVEPQGRLRLRRPGLGPAQERPARGGRRGRGRGPQARHPGRPPRLPRRPDPPPPRRQGQGPQHLARALASNPHFSPIDADEARRVLGTSAGKAPDVPR